MPLPVYVIVRDRFEQLRRTVSSLERAEGIDIVLVDNNTTYEPTREYLLNSPHDVVFTHTNLGHKAPWELGILPEGRFGLTDPDIEIVEECPNDWAIQMCSVLDSFPHLLKCGFSLKIDDIPDSYWKKEAVISHESQFWVSEVPWKFPLYDAALDTTLSVYSNNYNHDIVPAMRTGGVYTARHLAWYIDSDNLTEDEKYYREHCDRTVASWPYSEGM